jgi:hypothetical protein
MKKNKIFYSVATAAATLVMTAAPMVSTFATADNKAETHATFTVTEKTDDTKINIPDTDKPDTTKEGDDALQLVAVPSFDFGTVSTTELIAGKTMDVAGMAKDKDGNTVQDNAVKAGVAPDEAVNHDSTTNDKYHLTVSDLRGSDNSWDLSAKLSKFTNDDDATSTLDGTLNLKSDAQKVADEYDAGNYTKDYMTLADFSALNKSIDTDSSTDLYSTTAGRGINVAELSGSTLDLKSNKTAKAGHYTATINWELKSTATAPAAGTGTGSGN